MPSCAAYGCTKRQDRETCAKGITFHRFPHHRPELLRKWIANINRKDWVPRKLSRLCSQHFSEEHFDRTGQTVRLRPNAEPTIFSSPPYRQKTSGRLSASKRPYKDWTKKNDESKRPKTTTQLKCDAAEALLSLGQADSKQVVVKDRIKDEQTVIKQECLYQPVVLLTRISDSAIYDSQLTNTTSAIDSASTAVTMETNVENPADKSQETPDNDTRDSLEPLLREIHTQLQNGKVRQRRSFNFQSVSKAGKKFQFYTGLSASQFSHLLNYLSPNLNNLSSGASTVKAVRKQKSLIKKWKISIQDQLFLTLIKLRQAYPNKVLANRFEIPVETVAQIVKIWICFMHRQTTELRKRMLPSRELTQQNLPQCFKHSQKNARVIVDYFEILAQQPKNFFEHDDIRPSYKSHSAYKVLIGISPLGGVAFLSDAYEEKLSDMQLFLKSGLINRLEPEDLVLADTGFAIQQPTETDDNSNVRPAQENKNRLTPQQQLLTKSIARMKKYKIIDRPVCLALKPFISRIVHVVGFLVNYQEPLVVQ